MPRNIIKFEKITKFISNHTDLIVKRSINGGNLHYAITINFEKKYIKSDINELEDMVEWFAESINKSVKLVDYLVICIEFNKNGYGYLHALLAVKSLIGYNTSLKDNIEEHIKLTYALDTKIKFLKVFVDIKKNLMRVLKDLENDPGSIWLLTSKDADQNFGDVVDFLMYEELKYKIPKTKIVYEDIKTPKIVDYKYSVNTILNFWNYFLIFNNLYIYKSNIYKKVEGSIMSYYYIGNINYLIDNFDEIFLFFHDKFNTHFRGFDLYNLKLKFIEQAIQNLKLVDQIMTNKIIIDFNYMEFTDGVYIVNLNRFFKREKIEKMIKNNIATIKYYNKTYHNLE